MNEKQLSRVMGHLAEGLVPGSVDLWPVIRERFESSKHNSTQGDFSMNNHVNLDYQKNHNWRLRLAAISVLALLILAGLVFTLPQGRAWAQSVLRFFTRSESSTIPVPTEAPLLWITQTPGVPAATSTTEPTLSGAAFSNVCGDFRYPKCSVEQIRSKVNFTVKELGVIPAGMYFTGATGGPNSVVIFYDTLDHSGFISLTQEPWTGLPAQTAWSNVGPNAVVETVAIGSNTGEYVKGSFGYQSGQSLATWNDNAGDQNLKWVDNGVFTTLQRVGPDGQFDRDGLVKLAESLTTGPVAARLTPIPTLTPTSIPPTPDQPLYQFNLSLTEAGQKAGFTVRAPTYLPQILALKGASFDPETHLVRISYQYNDVNFPDNTDGLVITEEMVSDATHCDLCGFKVGDGSEGWADHTGTIVGSSATIETVQIGSTKCLYVEGVWNGTDNGPVWVSDPYVKTLRWQANGFAFELKYFGMEITKEDMIAIAESMK